MSTQWTEWLNPVNTSGQIFWQNITNSYQEDGNFATGQITQSNQYSLALVNNANNTVGIYRIPQNITTLQFVNYFGGGDNTWGGQTFTRDQLVNDTVIEIEDDSDGDIIFYQYNFAVIPVRATINKIEARIKYFVQSSQINVDVIQVRVNYSNFLVPFSTPSVTPSVFGATISNTIQSYTSPSISERGVVYSTSPTPTTSDTKVIEGGTGTGSYNTNLTGLSEATTYYARSYVIDTGETYYSEEISFTTETIRIENAVAVDIKGTTATLTANIPESMALTITERGFVWSANPFPTFDNNVEVVSGTDAGDYEVELTGLQQETRYFFRAYFKYTNSPEVTVFSSSQSFDTTTDIEVVKTYFYKFFGVDGSYRGAFYEQYNFEVLDLPEFTQRINGGRGDMTIRIAASGRDYQMYASEDTNLILQVWVRDRENAPLGEPIYTGINVDNKYTLTPEGFIDLEFFYISGETDMERKVLESVTGTTRISYFQQDPADIFKDILDKYALKGGIVTYTEDSIKPVGVPLSLTLQNNTILDSVREVIKFLPLDWYWYIDGQNVFHLDRTDFNQIDHELYIGKEVNAGEFVLSFGEMVNGVYYHGGDTGSGNLYEKYVNSTSRATFGVFDKIVSDERVTNTSTAQANATRILERGITPIRYIQAEVLDSSGTAGGYDIESLKVGDVFVVLSSSIPTQRTLWQNEAGTLGNMVWGLSFWGFDVNASLGVPFQIQEIEYRGDKAIVKASDVIRDTATTIVQLEKRAQIQATLNSPDSPN